VLILFSGLALSVEGVSLKFKLHLGATEAAKAAIEGAAHAADKIGPSEKTQKLMTNIGRVSKILGPIAEVNDEHVADSIRVIIFLQINSSAKAAVGIFQAGFDVRASPAFLYVLTSF
jgi:hypothetical protein